MWKVNLKDGHVKYRERYVNPLTGKSQSVSITMDKDTRSARKEAEAVLAEKIAKAVSGGSSCKGYTELWTVCRC